MTIAVTVSFVDAYGCRIDSDERGRVGAGIISGKGPIVFYRQVSLEEQFLFRANLTAKSYAHILGQGKNQSGLCGFDDSHGYRAGKMTPGSLRSLKNFVFG